MFAILNNCLIVYFQAGLTRGWVNDDRLFILGWTIPLEVFFQIYTVKQKNCMSFCTDILLHKFHMYNV